MAKIYSLPTNAKQVEKVKNQASPRPHVIKALLNYSKSLEVQKDANGNPVVMVLN